MEIIGISLPLWAVFLLIIVIVIVAWKLIKFALKLLLILIVCFVILIGLDFLGVFNTIQNFLSTII